MGLSTKQAAWDPLHMPPSCPLPPPPAWLTPASNRNVEDGLPLHVLHHSRLSPGAGEDMVQGTALQGEDEECTEGCTFPMEACFCTSSTNESACKHNACPHDTREGLQGGNTGAQDGSSRAPYDGRPTGGSGGGPGLDWPRSAPPPSLWHRCNAQRRPRSEAAAP